MSKIKWTFEKNEAIINLIDKFIEKHNISIPEQVYQNDSVQEDLSTLMECIVEELFPELEGKN